MTSRFCKLPSSFGVYSRLTPQQLSEIKFAAKSLVAAHMARDEKLWIHIIEESNKKFGKHERGILSGLALSLFEGKAA